MTQSISPMSGGAWAQAIAIDSSLSIIFINAFQALRERDKIRAVIFFTLTGPARHGRREIISPLAKRYRDRARKPRPFMAGMNRRSLFGA